MNKKIITLGAGVLITLSMVGCNNKLSSEDIESIRNQETVINENYNKAQDEIKIIDGYIELKYENKSIDSDEFRNCQKSIREIGRDLENINMDEMKEYHTSESNIEKYNNLKNKYNQINRSVKYVKGVSNMLKDDIITDDEAMDWICMKEICNSESPLSDEIKDNDEYKHIVEEYGFSLLDKQNDFDEKYGVEDID